MTASAESPVASENHSLPAGVVMEIIERLENAGTEGLLDRKHVIKLLQMIRRNAFDSDVLLVADRAAAALKRLRA